MKFLVVAFCLASAAVAWPLTTTYYSGYPRLTSYRYGSAPVAYTSPYVSSVGYAAPVVAGQSPSAKSALAYLNSLPLDTCGRQSKAFIEDILSGASPAAATAKATQIYQKDYASGDAPAPGSPCAVAEVAWKQAVAAGQDPVLNSAVAFMKAYGSESPCAVSALDYVQSILAGNTHANANIAAMRSFIGQIKILASQGKSTVDPVCAESARAYAASTGVSTPNVAAMEAFISKSLETGSSFDPVCLAAAENIFQGGSSLSAAKVFINLYKTSPTPAANSPCAAATKAYAAASDAASPGNKNALFAFIAEAEASGDAGLSPACEAAAVAYIAAFEAGASELVATSKAGKAYLAAVEANPENAFESSCAKAYRAYQG